VAFTASASVVVPIVIMTVPSSSKTKDLIVLSVAVIIFGVSVSWILQSRNMDTLAATAACAAVLVVFYGNVVNNNGTSKAQ
jgi:hydrogenase-4 membrane subunit HyfE